MSEEINLDSKVGERMKEIVEHLKKDLSEKLTEIVWTACNDYMNYADYEPLNNWKDRERSDLIGDKYSVHADSFWGKKQRQTIFEEHKEIILPLIKNEVIEEMEKEIKSLKERLEFEVQLNRNSTNL